MKQNKNNRQRDKAQANRDPITGAPGSHPVGTGIGAAGGAAAGAAATAAAGAAAGTIVGPAGTIAGGVIGAVVGGLAGKAIAEHIDPTSEEAYWREHHSKQQFARQDSRFEDYQGAYRAGYQGWARYGNSGRSFDELESEFQTEYDLNKGQSGLDWTEVRSAARAAWDRLDQRRLERYVGFDVVDRTDNKIGTLECLWSDYTGDPAFMGVKTGWLFGKTHVVPAQAAHVSLRNRRIRLPYDEQKVKDAPSYDADAELTPQVEDEVSRYYGLGIGTGQTHETSALHAQADAHTEPHATPEQATIQLSEEELRIGKREVEAGGVRLRKVVRTEIVNQPVELQKEELIIERVPAEEAHTGRQQAFNEQEVYIPLRREEAVVQKETVLKEEVRARKSTETEKQEIREQIRTEDVEIEGQGGARTRDPRQGRAAADIRETADQPRSQRLRDKD